MGLGLMVGKEGGIGGGGCPFCPMDHSLNHDFHGHRVPVSFTSCDGCVHELKCSMLKWMCTCRLCDPTRRKGTARGV